MNLTGIVVEYNPLHNGHIYHINKARELTNPDGLIAVMSGNFVQRGEFAIIDKWTRAKAAIDNGVDLVIELPYIYATQSATKFAYGAIESLKMCQINNLVFGSESNNLEELQEIAELSINPDHLKEALDSGKSYPKAYGLMAGSYFPNDILAISYLKQITNTNIKPYSIQRTNGYHDLDITSNISSATSIRKAIENNQDYTNATSIKVDNPVFTKNFYPYLRTLLLTLPKEYLRIIFLVNEGIENHLVKQAYKYDNYDDFIKNSITRRYTKSRINRTCLQILNQVTKKEVLNLEPLNHIRVLAFNQKGQEILKELKSIGINVCSKFSSIPNNYRQMEYRSTILYTSNMSSDKRSALLKREIQGPIIVQDHV